MQVDVYWNVHQRLFSIRHNGRVIGHAKRVLVRDAEFIVQPKGNAKVRETGHKVVHAFVRGQLEAWKGELTAYAERNRNVWPIWTGTDTRYMNEADEHGQAVTYNPLKDTSFVVIDGDERHPIHKSAGMVSLERFGSGRPIMHDYDPCKVQP